MFTSICPKCGRDLPLSSPECPFCVAPSVAAPPAEPQVPPAGYVPPGYPNPGYASQAYPPQGYPPQGYPQQPYPPQQYPPQQYPPQQYPQQPYPPQQYPPQQYPTQQFPAQAYPPQAYPPQQLAPQQAPQAVPPVAPTAPALPTIPMPPAASLASAPEAVAPELPPLPATYMLDDQPGRKGMPAWMGFLLAFVVIGGIVSTLIWYTNSRRENGGSGASSAAKTTKAKTKAGAHPASKYLELSGFRFSEGAKKKPQVQFVCINHGNVDIAELDVEVILRVKNSRPEDEPFGTFKVRIPGVGPLSSKEILVKELNTKLKFFDLPDWQFFDAIVTITSPADE